MNRRSFLGAMLAACAAPAIVRADSLMKIAIPSQELLVPSQELTQAVPEFGDPVRSMILAPNSGFVVGDIISLAIGATGIQQLYRITQVADNGKTSTYETEKYDPGVFVSDQLSANRRKVAFSSMFWGFPARTHNGTGPSIELPTGSTAMASQAGKRTQRRA